MTFKYICFIKMETMLYKYHWSDLMCFIQFENNWDL